MGWALCYNHYISIRVGNTTMQYSIQKQVKQSLESEVEKAKKVLKAFDKYGKSVMGLTPDFVKAMPEYKKAKADFDNAFKVLRKFNQQFVKQFRKEIAKERRERWN